MRSILPRVFFVVCLCFGMTSRAPAETEGLAWERELATPFRLFIDNEVHLPQFMWFVADRNKQVRVLAYQTTIVTRCDEIVPVGKRAFEMACQIEDIAIRAASSKAERNKLNPILAEMTTKLKAATVVMRMKTNGRLTQLSFGKKDSKAQENRRINQMNENLRLILYRAFAGVDLEFPKSGKTDIGYWIQYDSAILMAPSTFGTRGAAEIIHRIESEAGDTVKIHSSGEGTLTPGGDDLNFYAMNLEAHAQFNKVTGKIEERSWMCAGQPTASSANAQGGSGLPYIQRGVIKRVPLEAAITVGESGEVLPNMEIPGLIGTWGTIGAPAGEIQ